jgi:Family of unknown function (DUF6221)
VSDLAEWLRVQIAEDEAAARASGNLIVFLGSVSDTFRDEFRTEGTPGWATRVHFARWEPAQVLRECAAKRAILDLHQPEEGQHPDFCGHDLHHLPCPTLRIMAQGFEGRPGWDPAWKVTSDG